MRTNFVLAAVGAFLIIDTVISQQTYPHPQIDSTCECGKPGDGVSNRIVGGVVTEPHIFPWVVVVFYEKFLHCGGALINDRYVLTAGHCVKWSEQSLLEVGLGMHDIDDVNPDDIVPIDSVILHEDFESDSLHDTNDIALLKLTNPVTYSDTVRPICLPVKGTDYTDREVEVTGWGRLTADGETSKYLRKATLKVMPWDTCRNMSLGDHLTESMICAYADDTDACQGDSGGPMLFDRQNGKYETIGIVSWGIGCATPNSPGVYVKITDYLNWIKAHTSDGIYCKDD